MIYTTYFAKLNKLPPHIIPISICGKAPDWYQGLQYKKLAPKYEFFIKWKCNRDNDYYIRCFQEQVLDKLDVRKVLEELDGMLVSQAIDDDYIGDPMLVPKMALVCYERPEDFCHRHLVADWFNKNGIVCEEYKF